MLNCSWFQSFVSDPIKQDPILDQISIITRPYTRPNGLNTIPLIRPNGLKTIPFPAAHTHIANIWEYPPPPAPPPPLRACQVPNDRPKWGTGTLKYLDGQTKGKLQPKHCWIAKTNSDGTPIFSYFMPCYLQLTFLGSDDTHNNKIKQLINNTYCGVQFVVSASQNIWGIFLKV